MTLVAVLIPTTGRPQQARANLETLLVQPVPPDVERLVVAAVPLDDRETRSALFEMPGLTLFIRRAGTTAVQGWIAAYRYARLHFADWFVLGADDIIFHPGWLGAALTTAKATGAQVIGLDDGGHTDLWEYAPHYMASRAWCDEHGFIPQGYQSWWFDRDVCEHAAALGKYAPCHTAVLEHRHPDWGNAPMDETYRLGLPLRDQDKQLYLSRKAGYA